MTKARREKATGSGVGGTVRFVLPVVALWVVPVAIAAVAIPLAGARENEATTSAAPKTIVVGSVVDDAATPVVVTISTTSTSELKTRTSGLVTAMQLEPGSTIVPAQPLLSVGDSVVRAQVGPSPIVADVSASSRGADVERVGQLMAQAGLLNISAVGPTYNRSLRLAIDAWNAGANLPKDGTFRVSSTVFVRDGQGVVDDVFVRPGDSVDAAIAIAGMANAVIGVRFSPATEGTLAGLNGGALLFTAGDAIFGLGGLQPAPEQIPEFSAFLENEVAEGVLLETESDGSTTISNGVLSLADPTESATVPNSAIFIGANGAACVFTVDAGGSTTTATVPEAVPLSGASGLTALAPEHVGERVLADASTASEETRKQCA